MEPEPKTIHILLIDDDEDDYLILREYLTELDDYAKYSLDWEQTYQAGLIQIQRGIHDIYLVDHYLGAFSGLNLLQEVVQAGSQAPVIMITGQSDPQIDLASLRAGAMDYLVKGQIDGQLLERSIRYALERNRLLIKIRDLAVRDALTGMFNRRELHRFLDYELIKSRRYNHSFSILMMDIDHFKEINDKFGHRTGDEILKRVAQVLLSNTRGCDLASRYGGDEFILVLPETPASQAWFGAERIRKVLEVLSSEVINQDGLTEKIDISISIGVAEYPVDADSAAALIDLADQALYQAKRLGCNQTVRFHREPDKEQGSI
jgi:diguanylate cyclase (GGDEF)-like protein